MASDSIFRLLADVSHTVAKFILIWAIHCNRSAEGVSLITQVLYLVVFCTRYLDWFWVYPIGKLNEAYEGHEWLFWWNFILKFTYVATSVYTILIMFRVFSRTREREKAWRLGAYCAIGSAVASPLVRLIFKGTANYSLVNVLWVFSIILESVCVLPQLLLLRQTTVPTVIDSFYLVALGSYRALYMLSWMFRFAEYDPEDDHSIRTEPISVIFGLVQTALYIDFAWVYYSRQRVKLRAGGVVDSDDLSRGWLVSRIIGRKSVDFDADDGVVDGAGARADGRQGRSTHRWGARGISVSADDGIADESRPLQRDGREELMDPEAFEDDADSDAEERRVDTPEGHAQDQTDGANWGSE